MFLRRTATVPSASTTWIPTRILPSVPAVTTPFITTACPSGWPSVPRRGRLLSALSVVPPGPPMLVALDRTSILLRRHIHLLQSNDCCRSRPQYPLPLSAPLATPRYRGPATP